MRTTLAFTFVFVLGAVSIASAQRPRPEGRPEGPPRGNPIMQLIDSDRDGAISMDELDALVKKMKSLDKDGDGKLVREELAGLMPQRPEGRPGPGPGGEGRPAGDFLSRAMEADKNGDGKISKEEAPERMARGFDRIDANSDGFVTKDELQAMFERFQGGARPRPEGGRPRPDAEGGRERPRAEGDRPRRGGDNEEE